MAEVVAYFYWEKLAFLRKDSEVFKLRTSMADLLASCLDQQAREQLEEDRILVSSRKRIREMSPEPLFPSKEETVESESETDTTDEPDSNVHIESETDLKNMKDDESADEPEPKKTQTDPSFDNVSVFVCERADPLEPFYSEDTSENFMAQHKRVKRETQLACFDDPEYPFDFSSQLHTSSSNLFTPEEEQKEDDDPFFGSVFTAELL